ncbi:MerR family transcriptional regulator [Streptomyces sp. CC53]|uniref:MerR family transcriptional regulator n=1 Tax=Streptomyces sp. CC53 TaxID=1906740 RepID=UPI0008DD17D2|nr:MerR family transcriptional regulator [Streptomyces sp. CC53]OII63788.1 MerR family transcriptional regulator [Streptomyces sp. CC53]
MPTWLTAAQAADHATRARQLLSAGAAAVTVRTIRSWVARGHLTPTGLDDTGRQLFRLADVARAEQATRGRALRLVRLPETAHPAHA